MNAVCQGDAGVLPARAQPPAAAGGAHAPFLDPTGACSHLAALWLVAIRRRPAEQPPARRMDGPDNRAVRRQRHHAERNDTMKHPDRPGDSPSGSIPGRQTNSAAKGGDPSGARRCHRHRRAHRRRGSSASWRGSSRCFRFNKGRHKGCHGPCCGITPAPGDLVAILRDDARPRLFRYQFATPGHCSQRHCPDPSMPVPAGPNRRHRHRPGPRDNTDKELTMTTVDAPTRSGPTSP